MTAYTKTNMHELSIALGIVKIAEKETTKANAKQVDSIELVIGTLSGVEPEALEFVWDIAIQGTVLAKAKKHIEYIEAKAKCLECKTIFTVQNVYDSCPNCNSYFKDVFQGKELKVKALEVS